MAKEQLKEAFDKIKKDDEAKTDKETVIDVDKEDEVKKEACEDEDETKASASDEDTKATAKTEAKKAKAKLKEDFQKLVKETLSEETLEKTTVLFEAAINDKVSEKEAVLKEEYEAKLNEAKETLYEDVDKYLDYVVSEFIAENKLALEAGIKVQLAENFMTGLKNLFVENYIEVPEGQENALTKLAEEVETLKTLVTEKTDTIIALKEANEVLIKEKVISEEATELTEVQKEKLTSLTESLDFTSEDDYRKNVKLIVENFFEEVISKKEDEYEQLNENTDEDKTTKVASKNHYVDFMNSRNK